MKDASKILKTGFRLIAIIKILYEKSSSKAEIMEYFKKHYPFIDSFSNETLKLDVNTLKSIGFEIGRSHADLSNRRLYLKQKPKVFSFINDACHMFNMIKEAAFELFEIDEILRLQNLYKGLLEFIPDEFKDEILDFKFLNLVNKEVLDNTLDAVKNNYWCEMVYDSSSGGIKTLKCKPIKVVIRGKKLYTRCVAKIYEEVTLFRMDNIISMKTLPEDNESIEIPHRDSVRYFIKKSFYNKNPLERFENIVRKNSEIVEIEAEYEDLFFVVQRILSLGTNCVKIKDANLQAVIVKNLKQIMENYK